MMKLKKFRVTNFRSVMDSGWIDCDSITSLVGINEAGKSNLILALWKLKPARDDEEESKIEKRDDMPRHMYTEWKDTPGAIKFISAIFELDDALSDKVASLCGCESSLVKIVQITRGYDEEYSVEFPNYSVSAEIPTKTVQDIVSAAKTELSTLEEIEEIDADESNEDDGNENVVDEVIDTPKTGAKETLLNALDGIAVLLKKKKTLKEEDLIEINSMYPNNVSQFSDSNIRSKFITTKDLIAKAFSVLTIDNPGDMESVDNLIIFELPSFVYYSDYGNLDAEIYLPQAVKLLKSKSIGFDNAAKVRTLRMLFEFVNLNPKEVLELGKDPLTQEKVITITKTVDAHYPQKNKRVLFKKYIGQYFVNYEKYLMRYR